jgi:glutamate-1-semialdehyde 2,1-aminomutase
MQQISPLGPVYQAGTLSGNPLAMAAGIATLRLLTESGVYEHLENLTGRLVDGLAEAARAAGSAYTGNRVGSMFTGFFCDQPVTGYASAKRSDARRYARFFHAMLDRGVYLAPSQFEAGFVSLAHTEADIDATLNAAAAAFGEATLDHDA